MIILKHEERLEKMTEKLKRMTYVFPGVYDEEIIKVMQVRACAARRYLAEIKEVSSLLGVGHEVEWLSRQKFDRYMSEAEYSALDFDGEFCKVALINNFPEEPKWLITCVAPDNL